MNRAFDHSKYEHWIDPNKVKPYERNAKIHDEKNVANIAKSIEKFGWQQDTVVTRDMVLVIGHGRRLAAIKLGSEMPYHIVDKDAEELTEKDIRELRIADNLTNESEWDFDIKALESLDLDFTGFDFDAIVADEKKKAETEKRVEEMQLKQFEHHDYIVFVFDNALDWCNVLTLFDIGKVNAGYGKTKKSELAESLTEKDFCRSLDIRILILSRGRSDTIITNKLLPEWVEIVVPENEKSMYQQTTNNPIICTPSEVKGLGELRNWCLDNFENETLIMVDDDIEHFYCLTGERSKGITDPEELVQIFINTAVMAKESGAKVFGYAQTDIRKYNGCDPFHFCCWIGTIIGVIGRKYRFRDDKFKVDIDYCLQNLLVERIVWMDSRYWASNRKNLNRGGNSEFRTEINMDESIKTLQEKWGDCITVKQRKIDNRISFNFSRKQIIKI